MGNFLTNPGRLIYTNPRGTEQRSPLPAHIQAIEEAIYDLRDGVGGAAVASVVANQLASTAATVGDLKTDFNALLAKLKAAGIMAADPVGP